MNILPRKKLLLYAGAVLTGNDLATEKNVLIQIDEGIISGMDFCDFAPENALDCTGLTLVPGPVDCHVHLALDSMDFANCIKKWENPDMMEQQYNTHITGLLQNGITAVRDGGDRKGLSLNYKNKINSPPLIFASGMALHKEEMYGDFLGPGLETEQILEAIPFFASKGIDQLKILVSGLVSFKEYGRVGPVQFNLSEMQKITEKARKNGLKIMAHASSDEAVNICARAEVDSIEHGYFVTRDTLELMAENKIFWVPTFVPVANQLNNKNLSPHERDVIQRTVERHLQMLSIAAELGVPLAAGTDAGAPGVFHGKSFHEELQFYQKAGLSNREILKAATINGSLICSTSPGLETGKEARFIAVNGNPLYNLEILKSPVYVF